MVIPQALLEVTLYGTIIYWLGGLNDQAQRFFFFLLVLFFLYFTSQGYARVISYGTPDPILVRPIEMC